MRKLTRSNDIICRIGGDEFAALFPNCPLETAQNKMNCLELAVSALSRDFPMSVSYGIVHVDRGALITAAAVMDQADEKMYRMKNRKKAAQGSQNGFTTSPGG